MSDFTGGPEIIRDNQLEREREARAVNEPDPIEEADLPDDEGSTLDQSKKSDTLDEDPDGNR